jgi:hypothetical protein
MEVTLSRPEENQKRIWYTSVAAIKAQFMALEPAIIALIEQWDIPKMVEESITCSWAFLAKKVCLQDLTLRYERFLERMQICQEVKGETYNKFYQSNLQLEISHLQLIQCLLEAASFDLSFDWSTSLLRSYISDYNEAVAAWNLSVWITLEQRFANSCWEFLVGTEAAKYKLSPLNFELVSALRRFPLHEFYFAPGIPKGLPHQKAKENPFASLPINKVLPCLELVLDIHNSGSFQRVREKFDRYYELQFFTQ